LIELRIEGRKVIDGDGFEIEKARTADVTDRIVNGELIQDLIYP
jgi:hypothetical protein